MNHQFLARGKEVNMSNKVKLSVNIDWEDRKELEIAAEGRGLTMSALVQKLLKEFLRKENDLDPSKKNRP